MPELRFDLFAAASDEESARYRVLDGLQRMQQAFSRNEIYPHLSELIQLHETLNRLVTAVDAVRDRQPGTLKGIDLEEGRLIYDESMTPHLLAEDLARWVAPLLAELIEEGRTLYEFVEEHAEVRAVGIVPSYQDEGYLLVPWPVQLRVLRYAMSLYEEPDGRYRSLRTAEVAGAPAGASPIELKKYLVATHPELPNPATYCIDADMEFPIEATLLPVAKRKLLQYLAVGGSEGIA
jgi:hypothetical protein